MFRSAHLCATQLALKMTLGWPRTSCVKAWPVWAGLSKVLLSRAHSEGPGNVLASGGASIVWPHNVPLTKEPEYNAQEENPLGSLLHSLWSVSVVVPWTASPSCQLPEGAQFSWRWQAGRDDKLWKTESAFRIVLIKIHIWKKYVGLAEDEKKYYNYWRITSCSFAAKGMGNCRQSNISVGQSTEVSCGMNKKL